MTVETYIDVPLVSTPHCSDTEFESFLEDVVDRLDDSAAQIGADIQERTLTIACVAVGPMADDKIAAYVARVSEAVREVNDLPDSRFEVLVKDAIVRRLQDA